MSHDLTHSYFFLWGVIKVQSVKAGQSVSIEGLQPQITAEIRELHPETFDNSLQEFWDRLYYFLTNSDSQFEHLKKCFLFFMFLVY